MMRKREEKNSIIEICPIRNVVARFGNKWALLVIFILNENGSIRFNQLARQIPDISTKVLSNTLHTLEADGLVKRTVFPEVPIRVEYELTETGKTLVPIILSLTEWVQKNMKSILTHRKKFEAG
jgi:DNA-binding HxlR family transcriptional regulator